MGLSCCSAIQLMNWSLITDLCYDSDIRAGFMLSLTSSGAGEESVRVYQTKPQARHRSTRCRYGGGTTHVRWRCMYLCQLCGCSLGFKGSKWWLPPSLFFLFYRSLHLHSVFGSLLHCCPYGALLKFGQVCLSYKELA